MYSEGGPNMDITRERERGMENRRESERDCWTEKARDRDSESACNRQMIERKTVFFHVWCYCHHLLARLSVILPCFMCLEICHECDLTADEKKNP